MPRKYVSDIEKLAEVIRDAFDVSVPVDPERIAKLLGGSIKEVWISGDKDARILKTDSDSFIIEIKQNSPANRRKFSIAHELGHLFLHMGFCTDQDKWESVQGFEESAMYRDGYSREEKEANDFAGSLLMPKEEFVQVAKKNYDEKKTLTRYAPLLTTLMSLLMLQGLEEGIFSCLVGNSHGARQK